MVLRLTLSSLLDIARRDVEGYQLFACTSEGARALHSAAGRCIEDPRNAPLRAAQGEEGAVTVA